jgi:hypothetical protein
VRGMRDHPGRLVDDEQIFVFVGDLERDLFGIGGQRLRRFDRIFDDVAELEQGARFSRRAVDGRRPGAQRRGNVRARESGETGQKDVEPRPGIGVVDDVRQVRASRRSDAMMSSPTPMVIAASATLNTLGQIR